MKKVNKQLIL